MRLQKKSPATAAWASDLQISELTSSAVSSHWVCSHVLQWKLMQFRIEECHLRKGQTLSVTYLEPPRTWYRVDAQYIFIGEYINEWIHFLKMNKRSRCSLYISNFPKRCRFRDVLSREAGWLRSEGLRTWCLELEVSAQLSLLAVWPWAHSWISVGFLICKMMIAIVTTW